MAVNVKPEIKLIQECLIGISQTADLIKQAKETGSPDYDLGYLLAHKDSQEQLLVSAYHQLIAWSYVEDGAEFLAKFNVDIDVLSPKCIQQLGLMNDALYYTNKLKAINCDAFSSPELFAKLIGKPIDD